MHLECCRKDKFMFRKPKTKLMGKISNVNKKDTKLFEIKYYTAKF